MVVYPYLLSVHDVSDSIGPLIIVHKGVGFLGLYSGKGLVAVLCTWSHLVAYLLVLAAVLVFV